MSEKGYVVGVDYGTDSVRVVIVDADNGDEISSAATNYSRWAEGRYCDPAGNRFRQHPLDYIEGLTSSMSQALGAAPSGTAEAVKGISFDTTGSTPVAVDKDGVALAMLNDFADNPNGMFVLWKDHTAVREAAEINELARSWGGEDFTKYEGGTYSSEWFWAKVLHVLREDEEVRRHAFSWLEHCDWISALLTGETDPLTLKRSRCAAGHKAMWHASWDGLPAEEFLGKLDPLLSGLRGRLFSETFTADAKMGVLCAEWAAKLGLPQGIAIGVGAFDAHMGAVGGAIEPFALTKIMGTSTCDMVIAPLADYEDKLIKGICGQVDGSIVPGMLGMEAGQSAFGDVYAWFKDVVSWPLAKVMGCEGGELASAEEEIVPALAKAAAALPIDAEGVLAVDWFNGRRSPDGNQLLKGAISGMNLGSTAPALFRSLVEATAFGARIINERFEREGVPIKKVIALGGIPKKSPFVMQVLADVLERDIEVVRSEQACALGAAMFAATAAGLYDDVGKAQQEMGSGFEKTYKPNADNAKQYAVLYERYKKLGGELEARS